MTTKTPGQVLLPCPFCGQEPMRNFIEPHTHHLSLGGLRMPDYPGSVVIECGCGAGLIDDTDEAVTSRWNSRHIATQEQGKDAKDAARLDFIEKRARCDPKMDGQHVWWPTSFNHRLAGPTLRDAIDAAMAAMSPASSGTDEGGQG